jgi:hypothetical protein
MSHERMNHERRSFVLLTRRLAKVHLSVGELRGIMVGVDCLQARPDQA